MLLRSKLLTKFCGFIDYTDRHSRETMEFFGDRETKYSFVTFNLVPILTCYRCFCWWFLDLMPYSAIIIYITCSSDFKTLSFIFIFMFFSLSLPVEFFLLALLEVHTLHRYNMGYCCRSLLFVIFCHIVLKICMLVQLWI